MPSSPSSPSASSPPSPVNLAERLARFDDRWSPKVVEHRPVAHGVVHMLLIEPEGTPNTGDAATAAVKTAL